MAVPPSEPQAGESVLLRLRDACFGYHGTVVVDNADLTVERGDFLGLVGPNGAGKTTLLRGMIGQIKPLRGRVEWRSPPPQIGYVPQAQAQDPVFPVTAGEVVGMGAFGRLPRLAGMGRDEREYQQECLAHVGMAGVERRRFSVLSAGQKQRILIARALMTKPELLLLDEPTSGADEGAEETIMQLLSRLHQQGLAILMICHEMDTVRGAVKDAIWIHRGRLERGSAADLLSDESIRRRFGCSEKS